MEDKIEGYQNGQVFSSEVHDPVKIMKEKLANATEAELRAAAGNYKKATTREEHFAQNPEWAKYFEYLDELRDSGVTNMFGARPYLERAFGLEKREASGILSAWMSSFGEGPAVHKPPVKKEPSQGVTVCPECLGQGEQSTECPVCEGTGKVDKTAAGSLRSQASLKLAQAKEPLFKSRLIWALVDLHAAYGGDWNLIRKMLHIRFPKYQKEIDRFLANVSRNVESIHVLSSIKDKKGNSELVKLCKGLDKVADKASLEQKKVVASFLERVAADPKNEAWMEVGKKVLAWMVCGDAEGEVMGLAKDLDQLNKGYEDMIQSAEEFIGEDLGPVEGAKKADAGLKSSKAPGKGMFVELSHAPNIDLEDRGGYWQEGNPETGASQMVPVNSFEEASDICINFIEENGLGGGNWTGGKIYQDGKAIASVSYNGRVWEGTKTADAEGDMTLEAAEAVMAQLAKAEAYRQAQIEKLEAEIEAKYKLTELAAQAPEAEKRVKEGLESLKSGQRKYSGVLFRLKEVLHRRQFQPKLFLEMLRAQFQGQVDVQVKINELEQKATREQFRTTDLETVVQEMEPVEPKEPKEKNEPKEAPAKKGEKKADQFHPRKNVWWFMSNEERDAFIAKKWPGGKPESGKLELSDNKVELVASKLAKLKRCPSCGVGSSLRDWSEELVCPRCGVDPDDAPAANMCSDCKKNPATATGPYGRVCGPCLKGYLPE